MNQYLFRNRAVRFGSMYNHAIRLLHKYSNVLPVKQYNAILRAVFNMGTYVQNTFDYLDKYQLRTAEDLAVCHHDLKQARLINDSYSMLARHQRLHLGDVDRDRFIEHLHNKSRIAQHQFARNKVLDRRRKEMAKPQVRAPEDNRPQPSTHPMTYNPFTQPPVSSANATQGSSTNRSMSLSLSADRVASQSAAEAERAYQSNVNMANDQNLHYDRYNNNLDQPLHALRQDVDSKDQLSDASSTTGEPQDNIPPKTTEDNTEEEPGSNPFSVNPPSDNNEPQPNSNQTTSEYGDDHENSANSHSDNVHQERQSQSQFNETGQNYGNGAPEIDLNEKVTGNTKQVGVGDPNAQSDNQRLHQERSASSTSSDYSAQDNLNQSTSNPKQSQPSNSDSQNPNEQNDSQATKDSGDGVDKDSSSSDDGSPMPDLDGKN